MCRGVPMHIASTLWEVDSALCVEDGGVQIGGMEGSTHRRRQYQTVRFHLISHFVTASPQGEADCSLRPGEKVGGAG